MSYTGSGFFELQLIDAIENGNFGKVKAIIKKK